MVFVELISLTPIHSQVISVTEKGVYASESEVVVEGTLVSTHVEANLSTSAPFANALLLSLLALGFRKDVELGIELLSLVLVVVNTQFVVVSVLVLPLVVRLYIQDLHELIQLDVAEVVSQSLVSALAKEETITSLNVRNGFIQGPWWLVIDFLVVVGSHIDNGASLFHQLFVQPQFDRVESTIKLEMLGNDEVEGWNCKH